MTRKPNLSFVQRRMAFDKGLSSLVTGLSELHAAADCELAGQRTELEAQAAENTKLSKANKSLQAQLDAERALRLKAEARADAEVERRREMHAKLADLAKGLENMPLPEAPAVPVFADVAPLSAPDTELSDAVPQPNIPSIRLADLAALPDPPERNAGEIGLPDDLVAACEASVAAGDAADVATAAIDLMRFGLRMSRMAYTVKRRVPTG